MAVSDGIENRLRVAARRAYERGRFEGATVRGAAVTLLAVPALRMCGHTPLAVVCLAGFAAVVIATRIRGGAYEEGARAGVLAGVLPCLLPAVVASFDPAVCLMVASSYGLWICGAGGAAAGVILALRGRSRSGLPFWSSALAALGLIASIGCLPAGAVGFAGLALGMVAGGGPVLAARRATS